jgi:hypothetical protein
MAKRVHVDSSNYLNGKNTDLTSQYVIINYLVNFPEKTSIFLAPKSGLVIIKITLF